MIDASTASKVSKYGVFSGPYFPAFGLNTGKYRPEKTTYLYIFHAVLELMYAKKFRALPSESELEVNKVDKFPASLILFFTGKLWPYQIFYPSIV